MFLGGKSEPCNGGPGLASLAAQIRSITVYDLEGFDWDDYSRQDLQRASQASFNTDLFRELAPEARLMGKRPVWKGSRLAIAELEDGTQRHMALSYYGAFLEIQETGCVFVFTGEARQVWERAYMDEIVYEQFIPKRGADNKP